MSEDERLKAGDESGGEARPGDRRDDEDARGRHPDGLTDLSRSSWWEAVRRMPAAVFRDNVLNFAGALTYFAVLALLPAVVGFVSLLVIVGQAGALSSVLDVFSDIGPANAIGVLRSPIENVLDNRGAALPFFLIGSGFAIWVGAGYIGAFMWAVHHIYEVEDRRSSWRRRLEQLLISFTALSLLGVMSFTLILSGPLAEEMADGLDIAASGILVYRIVRWPVLFVAATLLFSVLYFYAPDVRQPGFRWISVGSITGVAGWMLATVVYDLYATRVVDYGQMYGSLGGVIVFLLWLWILNIALLAGAEVNAQLLRKRAHEGRAAAQAGGWDGEGGDRQ